MLPQKQGEEAMMSSLTQTIEHEEGEEVKGDTKQLSLKNFLWHGGSAYDAWFSCASNQVTIWVKKLSVSLYEMKFLVFGPFWFLLKQEKVKKNVFCLFVCLIFWLLWYAGSSGSVDSALLFLSAGNGFRNHIPSVVWLAW